MSAWPRASVTRARVAKLGPYGRAGWFASLTAYVDPVLVFENEQTEYHAERTSPERYRLMCRRCGRCVTTVLLKDNAQQWTQPADELYERAQHWCRQIDFRVNDNFVKLGIAPVESVLGLSREAKMALIDNYIEGWP